jgi:hypothetical protein
MLMFKGKDWTILLLNNKGRAAVYCGSKRPQQTVSFPFRGWYVHSIQQSKLKQVSPKLSPKAN